MRLVFAIITFALASVLLAVGIVVRAAPAPAAKYDYQVESTGDAPLTIIDGATLNALEGRQTLTVTGRGDVVAAYARRADVLAWIGPASYNEVVFQDADGQACTPDPQQPELCALASVAHRGTESTVPDPYGADIWVEDFRDHGSLAMTETFPADMTYVLASDGSEPAPSAIAIAWPTPPAASRDIAAWLIIGGATIGVIGLVLLLTAIHRMRNRGGPRRRMPKVPKRPTIKSVRSPRAAERAGAGVAFVALAIVALTAGGTAATAEPTPQPTPSPGTGEAARAIPALDARQIRRVVDRVTTTIASADEANDATLVATRVTGPALELKLADYALRSKDAAQEPASPVIPQDGELALSLPQQVPTDSDAWPRRLFVVVAQPQALEGNAPTSTPTPSPSGTADPAHPSVLPPVAMLLTQEDPRAPYQVAYLVALQADIPEVPAAEDGAAPMPPESPLVSFPLTGVASAYADILVNDAKSTSYPNFDIASDRFVLGWGLAKQQEQQAQQQGQESPNNMVFSTISGDDPLIALATTSGGAIVTGTVRQTVDVTPAESGAKVIGQGDIQLLSGVERSDKGYTSVYAGQLLFYVPPLDSKDPIVVLGYAGGIVSSKERS